MGNIFPRVTQREHVLEANMLGWDTELKWCLYSSGHSFHETASEILVMGISSPSLVFANNALINCLSRMAGNAF
jgi:hypothetical protein